MPDPAASSRRFRVALSFAGAQMAVVKQVAESLAEKVGRDRVFFYPWYEHETNGPDSLALKVPDFYSKHADLAVTFLSKEYVDSDHCHAEWRAVQALIHGRHSDRVMLFRFDQTEIEGLHRYDCYSRADGRDPDEIAAVILQGWSIRHGAGHKPAGDDAARLFAALRKIVGDRVLERLNAPPLSKLRTLGGFLAGPVGPANVETLVDQLHRATRECLPIWRSEIPERPETLRQRLIQDCLLLLGELLKLGVSRDLLARRFGPDTSGMLCLPFGRIGPAVAVYAARGDLPLQLSDVVDDGLDVSDPAAIALDGLGIGVGRDASDDAREALLLNVAYDELWDRVRSRPRREPLSPGESPPARWTPERLEQLREYIARHWRLDRRWYMLTLRAGSESEVSPRIADVARDMDVGLVVRSGAQDADLLTIRETSLVAMACEYIELLRTL